MKRLPFFILFLSVPTMAKAVTVKESCHAETRLIKDKNGNYQLTDEKEIVCESYPSDWRD